jgi:hypothetical protein
MTGGVFAVARSIWDAPDFPPEAFTQREAWMWLIGSAAWKEYRTRGANRSPIVLNRGEFSFSVRFLAKRWQWKKDKVCRFLQKLERRDMIRDTSRDNTQVYLVQNYNKYQVVGLPKSDTERHIFRDESATEARHERDKEEPFKHSNSGIESSLRSDSATKVNPDAHLLNATPKMGGLQIAIEDEGLAFETYNALAKEMRWPKAQRLTPERRRRIRARLRSCGGMTGWLAAMEKARASPFLRGEIGRGSEHSHWVPDLDFFLQEKSFTRLMEGKYDERSSSSRHRGSSPIFSGAAIAIARRQRTHEARSGMEKEVDNGGTTPGTGSAHGGTRETARS